MTARRILLVEDNPDDVELAVRAFRGTNPTLDIEIAHDGPDALAALLGSDGQPPPAVLPALVLLDLKLPRLDGFEVLKRLRTDSRTRFLPVVILTSSIEPGDLMNAYWLGANSYIRKPLSFQELVSAAAQIAGYWLQLNERVTTGNDS
jgi:two-component system response regulator